MRYVSIDIETTGLDPERHQVLSFAAVVDDLSNPLPLKKLPRFERCLYHETIVGDPVALEMNAGLIAMLAKKGEQRDGVVRPEMLWKHFFDWLRQHSLTVPIIIAGKNVSGFDVPFLKRMVPNPENSPYLQGWRNAFHYQTLDPGSMFVRADDTSPPSLAECARRAGATVMPDHTALNDALCVVECVRAGVTGQGRPAKPEEPKAVYYREGFSRPVEA